MSEMSAGQMRARIQELSDEINNAEQWGAAISEKAEERSELRLALRVMEEETRSARQLKWDRRFLEMERLVSTWSKDPSTKVGCVVVDCDNRVRSIGYNGFPPGVDDTPERYNDRPTKYMFIEHADRNAIYSATRFGTSLMGCTMYLPGPPCHDCMRGIIQAGITRVVFPENNMFESGELAERWKTQLDASRTLAQEAGVRWVRVPAE